MRIEAKALKIVIAGGAGTLGRVLAKHLQDQGSDVVVLSRRNTQVDGARVLVWDGLSVSQSWARELAGSVLINLSGELVDRVPTDSNIQVLENSRVEPTHALVEAARKFGEPKLWLQMSTLAIYGDAGDQVLTESSSEASGPRQMAGVARAWEAAAKDAPASRKVILRTAVVLQPGTPALNRLVRITKLFLDGTVASGRQWVSWVDYRDFIRALVFIIEHEKISGIVHVTNPNPVTNKGLMQALRKAYRRPWSPPTPAFLIKLGATLLFRTDPMLALTGRRAIPQKLTENGFKFDVEFIDQAIR
ncbi:MAG: DUF1731 domain-containing protein [Rhodoluna sp.]|nr:DUF1731 domain-containing protein [Rhodoluna sp.]